MDKYTATIVMPGGNVHTFQFDEGLVILTNDDESINYTRSYDVVAFDRIISGVSELIVNLCEHQIREMMSEKFVKEHLEDFIRFTTEEVTKAIKEEVNEHLRKAAKGADEPEGSEK